MANDADKPLAYRRPYAPRVTARIPDDQASAATLRSREYQRVNRDKFAHRKKTFYLENRDKILAQGRVLERRRRVTCLEHYGAMICACCGEHRYEFLTIDHIEGGGNQHLEERKATNQHRNLYSWLIKNNFPPGYQVLCYNCNCAKGNYGECPHTKERREREVAS